MKVLFIGKFGTKNRKPKNILWNRADLNLKLWAFFDDFET